MSGPFDGTMRPDAPWSGTQGPRRGETEGSGSGDRVDHQGAPQGERYVAGRPRGEGVREPSDYQLMGERQDLPGRPEPASALGDLRRDRGLFDKGRRRDHERSHREGCRNHPPPGVCHGGHAAAVACGGGLAHGAVHGVGLGLRPGDADAAAGPRALGQRHVRRRLGGAHQARPRPRDLRRGARLLGGEGARPRYGAGPPGAGAAGLDAHRAHRRHGASRRRGGLSLRALRPPAARGALRLAVRVLLPGGTRGCVTLPGPTSFN